MPSRHPAAFAGFAARGRAVARFGQATRSARAEARPRPMALPFCRPRPVTFRPVLWSSSGRSAMREECDMQLAYTMASATGETDLILAHLAEGLSARGLRLCGTVQINTERITSGPCDMDLRVLPDGPVLRISQDLGAHSRGCRLNPAALETAVGLVAERLVPGIDLLILNKFGKHEAEGRGFREVIGQALDLGVPVLVGVNRLNLAAFEAFAGGLALPLPPRLADLQQWADRTVPRVTGDVPSGLLPVS
jgi:hypothetical protein